MKRKQIFLIIVICSIYSLTLYSQSSRSIEGINISDVIIMDLAPNGDVWLGSANEGVGYYNSANQQWSYFKQSTHNTTLHSDTATSIIVRLINGKQYSYIGTTNGIAYTRVGVWDSATSLVGKNITGLVRSSSDTLWVTTTAGTYAYNDTSFVLKDSKTNAPYNQFTLISSGMNCHSFVAGTADTGAYVINDLSTALLPIDTSQPHGKLVDNRITALLVDNSCQGIHIGTKGGYSFCRDSANHILPCINFTTANGMPQNTITSIAQSCNGQIWVGTKDSGIVIFSSHPPLTIVGRITTANGLSDNRIKSVAFASDTACHRAWVSMQDSQIAVVDTNGHVVKFVNGIQDPSATTIDVLVYPQPSVDKVNFVFPRNLTADMYLTDMSGRILSLTAIKNTPTTMVDIASFPTGLYFYRIYTGSQLLKAGKLQVIR